VAKRIPEPFCGCCGQCSTVATIFERLEIEHFFLIYKELEPGKSVEGASWAGRAAAEAEVEASRRRLRETP
jgi:inorganic pyrophosphatase